MFQAIGQVLYLRPYVNDFSTEWVLSSVALLTIGSVLTTYIGERISDLKLGNGTSLLIFTNILSYLPASFGRTIAEAFQNGNYIGLATIILSFVLLVFGIVYVQVSWLHIGQKYHQFKLRMSMTKASQEAERKIPINYASRYMSKSGGLKRSAYLPFKVSLPSVFPAYYLIYWAMLTSISSYVHSLLWSCICYSLFRPTTTKWNEKSYLPYLWDKGTTPWLFPSNVYSIAFYFPGKIV